MSWKDRFTYNSSSAVEHQVNGNTVRFFPNRIGLLTELAEIAKPVGRAVATLFGDSRNDTTSVSETFRDKVKKDLKSGLETAESVVDKITVQAVAPEVADHKRKERDRAIDELIEAVTNTRNRYMLGRLLMDSMREEFPYKKDRPAAEVEEFLDGDGDKYQGIDLPTLKEMMVGWLKANAKVFGSTGEKVTALVRGKLEALQTPSPSEEMPSTVNGSSSRTLSLVRSEPASE